MTSEATDIQVLDNGIRFQARHDLYIDGSLHYFFKFDDFSVLLFYLNLNRRLEIFSEIADHSKLIGDLNQSISARIDGRYWM